MSGRGPQTPELDAEVTTAEQLVAWLRSGEKPPERWRVGTEHEKIGLVEADRSPVPYEGERGIGALLGAIADADGWVRFNTVYPSWYGGRTPHIHFKVFVAARQRLAGQAFFEDEVNAEIFEKQDPYREHFRKRKAFNDNDPFIDANHDGHVDGVFFDIERHDGGALAAKAVLTVKDA